MCNTETGRNRSFTANENQDLRPDYAGFVVEVSKSRRNVSVQQLRRLTALLDHGIVSVGVFVNAPVELIVGLLQDGVLAMAQLHGQEDASYVEAVKEQTGRPVVQAFSIRTQEDVQRAFASPADYILLDQGGGGTGRTFDWSLLERSKAAENKTPFFLAGGLGVDNLEEAIRTTRPFAVDLSSSLETDGRKETTAGKGKDGSIGSNIDTTVINSSSNSRYFFFFCCCCYYISYILFMLYGVFG